MPHGQEDPCATQILLFEASQNVSHQGRIDEDQQSACSLKTNTRKELTILGKEGCQGLSM